METHTELAEFREDREGPLRVETNECGGSARGEVGEGECSWQKLAGSGAVTRNIMRKLAVTIPHARKKESAGLKRSERIWNSIFHPPLPPNFCQWKMYRETGAARSTYFFKQCNLIRAREKSSWTESPLSDVQASRVKLHSYSSKFRRQKFWERERKREKVSSGSQSVAEQIVDSSRGYFERRCEILFIRSPNFAHNSWE